MFELNPHHVLFFRVLARRHGQREVSSHQGGRAGSAEVRQLHFEALEAVLTLVGGLVANHQASETVTVALKDKRK